MKKTLMVFLLLLLFAVLALAEKPAKLNRAPVPFDGRNAYEGNIAVPPSNPVISSSPGDSIGVSYYAYQTNGSTGNRISVDSDGNIHVAWTKGMAAAGRPRYVNYNYRDSDNNWLGDTRVSTDNGTGFVVMDILPDGRAIPVYHTADVTPSHSILARDAFAGFGIFEEFDIPSNGIEYIWPYASRDFNGKIHVINADYNSTNLAYTYSTNDGETWAAYTIFGTYDVLSYTICSSPVSPKTAILYTFDTGSGFSDVFYFETTDGTNWNWGDPYNITEFVSSDSMSAYADIDGIYDYNDNLHIAYQGQLADADGVYIVGDLMHWSVSTGHNFVASSPDNCSPINYCTCICKMSLGVNPVNNNLYALWSELSEDDVSAAGFSNGELYAAASADGGANWFEKVNLTNSPSPGCSPPNCDSDVWSSLAEKVDGDLHIMYIDDNDAGAEWRPEGAWTNNRVLYLEIDELDLLPTAVHDDIDLPFEFNLGENYPNPFNAETIIPLEGELRDGRVAIYDIAGRLIRDFNITSETHSITWDGTNSAGTVVSSGTYFYSVSFDGFGTAAVRKMTMLK